MADKTVFVNAVHPGSVLLARKGIPAILLTRKFLLRDTRQFCGDELVFAFFGQQLFPQLGGEPREGLSGVRRDAR